MELNQQKFSAIFWDFSQEKRIEIYHQLQTNPKELSTNEFIVARLLNSLSWFELIHLFGTEELIKILNTSVINKLFPVSRRNYYKDAQRLLSKYSISTSR